MLYKILFQAINVIDTCGDHKSNNRRIVTKLINIGDLDILHLLNYDIILVTCIKLSMY